METNNAIYFYGHTDSFGYMSNFYKCGFVDEQGVGFCCSEQYLMYWKAKTFEPENIKLLETILNESNPTKIKAMGRKVANYNEEIWNQIRLGIMINGLRLKFGQNQAIRNALIGTGTKTLYEASKNDKIWGIGYDAANAIKANTNTYGTNLLGRALMTVRGELANNK